MKESLISGATNIGTKFYVPCMLILVTLLVSCVEDLAEQELEAGGVLEIDNFGVRPALFFSITDQSGHDIFRDQSYRIEELKIFTRVSDYGYVQMNERHISKWVLDGFTVIGVDDLFILNELVFDYSNSDADTVSFQNGDLLRQFRGTSDMPEFTGVFRILFNKDLIRELEFLPTNDNIKMIYERNVIRSVVEIADYPMDNPFIIQLQKK